MMIQGKAGEAVACFKQGYNCAQAVFSTYSEELGLDRETALKVSCGFGAGMGRRQETCGAVAGACLLIGLKYGKVAREDDAAKEKTYALVREFAGLFEERNGTTNCRELLGVDMIDGDKQAIAEGLKTVCPKMVQDAAEIIEELL